MRWLKAEAQAGRLPHVKAETRFLFDPEAVTAVLMRLAQDPPQWRADTAADLVAGMVKARRAGDAAAVAQAQGELERLGVKISFADGLEARHE